MRESVERFLDGGNSLKSGINAVHNLTAAIWVKASEVGFIEAKSVANDSYNKIGGCGVDRIADHTVDLGNGRTLEANGLQYYTGSSLGGDSGSITITNLRGNKIEIKLRDGKVMDGSIDGKIAIVGDGRPETMVFNKIIGQIAQQYLALEDSSICAGPTARTVRALEEF